MILIRNHARMVLCLLFIQSLFVLNLSTVHASSIPLPEHPRPDFQRADWMNLNGTWQFCFDSKDVGIAEKWIEKAESFEEEILVPFPWGSKLSGVEDKGDIGWYTRTVTPPASWKGKRIFLVIGACDWRTTAWLDGRELGTYQGGYTPFEFELTPYIQPGIESRLVLRVDDTEHPFKLNGKQGYGPARGIWQTPYLEARSQTPLAWIQFTPDIDEKKVHVQGELLDPAPRIMRLSLQIKSGHVSKLIVSQKIARGAQTFDFEVSIPQPRLWTLEDPFLYEVTVILTRPDDSRDSVNTYFGMRKISVVNLPGTEIPYVALNNKPLYLEMTLDQAYHPDGFYTFPSDEFMRDEILRSRRIGLNAMRVHVKTPIPRKLYWADKLGMLIMADVPNSWGEPDANMRKEAETALRGMIRRDFNHPSIFSWVIFNETWGLKSGKKGTYLPETQKWVLSMYTLAKSLDPTRLVEDNSPCLNDHVETDLNTWHSYLPGYEWTRYLDNTVKNTYPGSEWNFAKGYKQSNQPMMNSECGNVWGYEGSAGDVDWSWDYHLMMNAFRRRPEISGWLYTEHHDVINEWNGYYRFDRSEKYTGMPELADGMTLNDLHGDCYIALSDALCQTVDPRAEIHVPVYASFFTDKPMGDSLILRWELYGWDTLGQRETYAASSRRIPYAPWMNKELEPLIIKMPDESSLAILRIALETEAGTVLHRNFTTFLVSQGSSPRDQIVKDNGKKKRIIRIGPGKFWKAEWSQKQWNVLDGLKVNGAGSGYFEYFIPWPENLSVDDIADAAFLVEASAKQLFGKDREGAERLEGDFMRGRGTHDPSLNRNAYPMTDTVCAPSAVRAIVSGQTVGVIDLPDDPADHRGILSWHSQKRDRFLREAGSYGYLISVTIPKEALERAAATKEIVIRLEVDEAMPGGLAIYGERFGRYPIDPSVVFVMK